MNTLEKTFTDDKINQIKLKKLFDGQKIENTDLVISVWINRKISEPFEKKKKSANWLIYVRRG